MRKRTAIYRDIAIAASGISAGVLHLFEGLLDQLTARRRELCGEIGQRERPNLRQRRPLNQVALHLAVTGIRVHTSVAASGVSMSRLLSLREWPDDSRFPAR